MIRINLVDVLKINWRSQSRERKASIVAILILVVVAGFFSYQMWTRAQESAKSVSKVTAPAPAGSDQLRKAAAAIYKSPLASAAYKWAMPSVKAAFKTMPERDQSDYLRILDYASSYLARLKEHYPAEVRYWESLEKGGCFSLNAEQLKVVNPSYCTMLFTRFGPDGKSSSYRKVEAFIFRRVHFDGIGADLMKAWLDGAVNYIRQP